MIRVEGLTKYYDEVKAVDGIDFAIERGEIVGLLGPNGAGKSTTLRMLTCYLTPTRGNAEIGGTSITDEPLRVKQMIGYLPESAPLYNDMIVFDYLTYIARIQNVEADLIPKRIAYVAEKCGLEGVMHKRIRELSKGYKQRVGLGHAIIHDPEILILDEPTSGLDPNQIVEIRSLIQELGQEKTVILSTHILSEVEASCDRVIIIANGNIVADNTTRALVAGTDKTALMLKVKANASVDEAKQTLASVAGVAEVRGVQAAGTLDLTVTYGASEDLRESIYNAVKATDWAILEMRQEAESLEAIFQELTKEAHA